MRTCRKKVTSLFRPLLSRATSPQPRSGITSEPDSLLHRFCLNVDAGLYAHYSATKLPSTNSPRQYALSLMYFCLTMPTLSCRGLCLFLPIFCRL